jgi:hypothetical protein
LITCLCIFSLPAFPQQESAGRKDAWYRPRGAHLEYAGGFGMFSAGISIEPGRYAEVTLSAGYTPPPYGDIWTTNLLLSYDVIRVKLSENISVHPVIVGAFLTVNYGDNIYVSRPDYYPEGYYWWNSAIRYGPFINTEIKFTPDDSKHSYSLFFRTLTNDLYIYSYASNTRYLSISDILVFGLGIKICRTRAS